MPVDFKSGVKLSLSEIGSVASYAKSLVLLSDDKTFDIIKFLETDIQKIIPEFYLFIESDELMDGSKAFTTDDSKCIVVSESVYNDACHGYFYARKILAHEFGHVLLHHNISNSRKHYAFKPYEKQGRHRKNFEGIEWQAEMFALILLVPERAVSGGKLHRDFTRKSRMSSKMVAYVESKISSYKKRDKTVNYNALKQCIDEFNAKSESLEHAQIEYLGQIPLF